MFVPGKCREALKEEGGDVEKAIDWLKKRGLRSMEKRTAESAEALLSLGIQQAGVILELRAARVDSALALHLGFNCFPCNSHSMTESAFLSRLELCCEALWVAEGLG